MFLFDFLDYFPFLLFSPCLARSGLISVKDLILFSMIVEKEIFVFLTKGHIFIASLAFQEILFRILKFLNLTRVIKFCLQLLGKNIEPLSDTVFGV